MSEDKQKILDSIEKCRNTYGQTGPNDFQWLLAELKAAWAREAWLPIETAPRDGTHILLCSHEGILIGFWNTLSNEGFTHDLDRGNYQPTHWMPLPPPPEQAVDIVIPVSEKPGHPKGLPTIPEDWISVGPYRLLAVDFIGDAPIKGHHFLGWLTPSGDFVSPEKVDSYLAEQAGGE